MNWNILQNLDLFSVGIVVASTLILGFMVYFNNRQSATNKAFLFFCIMTVAWGTLNYINYNIGNSALAFWALRIAIFFAVWHAYSLFKLFYVFPEDHASYPKLYSLVLVPLVAASALLTLTPFVFSHVVAVTDGRITQVANGPGIVLFSATILGLVVSGVGLLIKKVRDANGQERRRLTTILYGILLTFFLILLFNFIFPAFLKNARFTPLGALFIFPFIIFTSYAIVKRGFFNVKVISTEILVFVLAIVTLFEVIFSTELPVILFRLSEFLAVLAFGILLVQSVLKEVKQREQLQVLTKQLAAANVQLKQLDQARADFITLTSHQLRTPPATIKWYLAAIQSGDFGALTPELKDAIAKAEITNNALISLIDDLLNASRIERGKLEFLFDPVNLDELASFMVEQLQPQAHMKNLTLKYEKPTGPIPEVLADKEKIRQVINNFIDNAIKYTPKGGITTRVRADQDFVYVEVEDTGKGIETDTIPTLFQKYTRGKDSITHATGIGIGLYVAKIVIQNHNGDIAAKSPGVGKGSTFFFRLPIKSSLPHTKIMDLVKEQSNSAL
jgi:signal transduction histidine kinase